MIVYSNCERIVDLMKPTDMNLMLRKFITEKQPLCGKGRKTSSAGIELSVYSECRYLSSVIAQMTEKGWARVCGSLSIQF